MRFEMRRVRSRFTPYLTLKQNWPSDKGEVVLFPVKVDESLKSHLVLLLEAAWTYHVLPELHKKGLDQGALFAVQVLYPPDRQPFVRLGEEVRVKATMLERREGWLSESSLLLKLSPGFVRQSPTKRIVDIELLDDERTRYGHFTCLRVEGYWWGIMDLLGLLPQSAQDAIEAWEHSPPSRNIILSGYGGDSAKDQLLHQLNVDMCSLSEPLNEEVLNLVYATVYRAWDDTPVQQMPSVVSHRIIEAIDELKQSYSWEGFAKHGAAFSDAQLKLSAERIGEVLHDAERIFAKSGLTEWQTKVLKLETILCIRGEQGKWTEADKAKYLGMKQGNYRQHLYQGRLKTQSARHAQKELNGYERLLRAIFGGGP